MAETFPAIDVLQYHSVMLAAQMQIVDIYKTATVQKYGVLLRIFFLYSRLIIFESRYTV